MDINDLFDELDNIVDTFDYITLRNELTNNLYMNLNKDKKECIWLEIQDIEQYFLTDDDEKIKQCYRNFCSFLEKYSIENNVKISYDLEQIKNTINVCLLVKENIIN